MNRLVAAAVLLSAMPALPCSRSLPGLITGIAVPFEGRDVPLNAELRAVLFVADFADLSLEGPGGERYAVGFEIDALGARFIPEQPLVPGAHTLLVTGPDATTANAVVPAATRVIAFNVLSEPDFDPPPAPLGSGSVRTVGDPLRLNTCASTWPTDEVSISVDGAADAAIMTVDDALHGNLDAFGRGSVVASEGEGGDVEHIVTVTDLAGNTSEPTIVTVWAGCDGGCSGAGGVLPLAGVLLVLARVRSRPRRRCR